jgi:hypothetical protein
LALARWTFSRSDKAAASVMVPKRCKNAPRRSARSAGVCACPCSRSDG